MHARRNRLARMEQEYWGELASPLPPATARVWTALEGAMQRYTGVLKDRANLVEEVGSLQHVRRRRCPATPAVVCPPLTRARWAGLGCEAVAGKRRAAGAAEPVLGRSRQRGAVLPAHAGNSCAQDVGPTHASIPASHSLYCSLLQALRTGRRLILSLVSFPKRNATPLCFELLPATDTGHLPFSYNAPLTRDSTPPTATCCPCRGRAPSPPPLRRRPPPPHQGGLPELPLWAPPSQGAPPRRWPPPPPPS